MQGVTKKNEVKILLSSSGRCGSTYIANLISKSGFGKWKFKKDWYKRLYKFTFTHSSWKAGSKQFYKGIFLWAGIGDTISSMYFRWDLKQLNTHFDHLNINPIDILLFNQLYQLDKDFAFAYLVFNDKFGFKRNIKSWGEDSSTIVINYEWLCKNPEEARKRISKQIGRDLPKIEIKPRKHTFEKLPRKLRLIIEKEYGNLTYANEHKNDRQS